MTTNCEECNFCEVEGDYVSCTNPNNCEDQEEENTVLEIKDIYDETLYLILLTIENNKITKILVDEDELQLGGDSEHKNPNHIILKQRE